MKTFKKLLALGLALVMTMAMTITVSAATIEVDGALEGETYTAYKLLEYTSDTTVDPAAYSYYLLDADYQGALGTALKGAGFEFTQSADKTQWFVSNADELTDGAAIAKTLYESIDDWKDAALATANDTGSADGKVEFTDLPTGYWFVTSSLGSLCTLQSYDDEELVVEKNSMITDDKEVDEDSENAQVGDVLNYTITLTDGKGTNLEAKIVDTLSKGLTYNADAKASINGGEAASITGAVTENADGTTTVVYTFDAETMTALEEGQTIVVTYTATVNADASIDGTVSNTEYTEYSEQETDGNEVETDLTDMTVNKTDGTNALKGAQFKLYRTDDALELDHVDVKLRQLTDDELTAAGVTKADNTVYYTVDPDGTNLIDMAQKESDAEDAEYLYSSAVVYGLDKDSTYYLEETKAPEGYNLLEEEKEVNLGTTTSIDVENKAGSVLPSTGGMGTTIFYALGAVLVLGAGVMMVTKRRMSN
ncbi:MAG: SpaH/EbpB family LPXTG-anchored major pilin [Butyrivibrio sp.]|nr:SpaH/EbpB family LPXTG-anchored major pilin [Butyrivibrio sp.]